MAASAKKDVKGTYVSIHSSGFRDFLLKPELLRAIVDCGFEHPSAVQHECIPQVTRLCDRIDHTLPFIGSRRIRGAGGSGCGKN